MKWITKIVLVALVIWAFLLANQVILQNQQMFQRHVKDSVARLQQPALPNTFDSAPPPAFPWRKFPGATLLSHRSWKMNEIPFLEAEYQVTASPGDLIEYYRHEMARSGWRDITESYFNIDPELLAQSGKMEILQSSNFTEKYRKITEANLALQRGQESVYLTIRPPGNKSWQTSFNLTYAKTPSAKDLWIETYTAARNTSFQKPFTRQFTMEEKISNKRMASTSYTSHLPPQSLYNRMAQDLLQSKGWRTDSIPVGLKLPGGSRVQAFTHGKSFALLSVRYDEHLQLSTALLTLENPL